MTYQQTVQQGIAPAALFTTTEASEPAASATSGKEMPCGWQVEAVNLYRQAHRQQAENVGAELAACIEALTGVKVAAGGLFVDRRSCRATASLQGVTFRLQAGEMVLVRPCSYCGCGLFTSPAIKSRQDLGYAIGVWEPLCQHCPSAEMCEWGEE